MGESLSQRHEREIAALVPNGETTIASGQFYEKRDVQSSRGQHFWRTLIECKCTQAKSYSVGLELLQELVEDTYSRSAEFRPSLAIRFYKKCNLSVSQVPVLADVICVPVDDYAELLHERERLQTELEELKRASIPSLGEHSTS